MLNNFNKYINFNIFNKNKNKYIKINTKNIYNYLTSDNILYINNKINSKNIYPEIYTNLLYSIKISIKSWLIKDKNILQY